MTKNRCITNLAYYDASKAIVWLCDVFGFSKLNVFSNADGTIAHAELTLDGGMIMISTQTLETPFSKNITHPNDIGGLETMSIYLAVKDADTVYEKVLASGVKIEIPIKDESYGGRGFSCRDLENRLWSIGTYDPWVKQ